MTNNFMATMVRLACEQADAQGATLYRVSGDVLLPYVIYNLPRAYITGIGPVRVGTQCCGRAVEHRRPWIVGDMLNDPLFADGISGAMASEIRAGFSVPVLDGERAIASLACHYTSPRFPSDMDIERNQVLAKLIGIALRGMPAELAPPSFHWPGEGIPA